ncbi:MAG TPA: hotdog domain-containing protein [Bacteroidales bacterium]|nr:hotdog domain-containing protein [Bacteroidales bacterium]HQL70378.1 hotdog domain-containing protein [Bacteroidales bacterium]
MKNIVPVWHTTSRLVKGEDLNHHGSLFAGRSAEWFVESGFISVAALLNPKNVVCMKIHGMHFKRPAYPGEVITFSSKVVYTGRSSIVSYVKVTGSASSDDYVNGFITFIHVDDHTRALAHNLVVVAETDEDKELYSMAENLRK